MLEILLLSLLNFVCEDPVAVKERDDKRDEYNQHLQLDSLKYKELALSQILMTSLMSKTVEQGVVK